MAKKAAVSEATDSGVLLQLDPSTVLADDNTRYNLKESRILTLADSIVSQGGVIEPVEVEPLPEPQNGFKYRLTLGYYRHAAVKHLNTTQAAGLTLPALVHVNAGPTERLKRQLAENIERENQSPMDQAIAIKRLMDAGIPRIEIRQMFSRPGGRKGGKVQAASNSFINMTVSFLDLPKSAQQKIHEGIVGVGAAYQLTKVDPEKRDAVLKRAEDERKKQLEREEQDEERFLAGQKKAEADAAKVEAAKVELEQAEAKSKEKAELLEKKTSLVTDLFAATKVKHTNPKEKKAAAAAFTAAEKDREAVEKEATEAQKGFEKAQVAFSKLVEKPTKPAPKPNKVGGADIKKAAKDSGASTGAVPLTAVEMRKVVAEMALPTGDAKDAKLILIGRALADCFSGITTDKQCFKAIREAAK